MHKLPSVTPTRPENEANSENRRKPDHVKVLPLSKADTTRKRQCVLTVPQM